jgi:hypothetical protein
MYGYARVSTDGQSVEAQVAALPAAGAINVYREVVSGAKTDRTQLRQAFARLAGGDVLTATYGAALLRYAPLSAALALPPSRLLPLTDDMVMPTPPTSSDTQEKEWTRTYGALPLASRRVPRSGLLCRLPVRAGV